MEKTRQEEEEEAAAEERRARCSEVVRCILGLSSGASSSDVISGAAAVANFYVQAAVFLSAMFAGCGGVGREMEWYEFAWQVAVVAASVVLVKGVYSDSVLMMSVASLVILTDAINNIVIGYTVMLDDHYLYGWMLIALAAFACVAVLFATSKVPDITAAKKQKAAAATPPPPYIVSNNNNTTRYVIV